MKAHLFPRFILPVCGRNWRFSAFEPLVPQNCAVQQLIAFLIFSPQYGQYSPRVMTLFRQFGQRFSRILQMMPTAAMTKKTTARRACIATLLLPCSSFTMPMIPFSIKPMLPVYIAQLTAFFTKMHLLSASLYRVQAEFASFCICSARFAGFCRPMANCPVMPFFSAGKDLP